MHNCRDRHVLTGPAPRFPISCVRRSTPVDAALTKPEVGAAALLQPHRWGESRQSLRVNQDVPAWLCFGNHQELNHMTATAGAAHADTPVLAVVARKDDITPRQARGKTVPVKDSKSRSEERRLGKEGVR